MSARPSIRLPLPRPALTPEPGCVAMLCVPGQRQVVVTVCSRVLRGAPGWFYPTAQWVQVRPLSSAPDYAVQAVIWALACFIFHPSELGVELSDCALADLPF